MTNHPNRSRQRAQRIVAEAERWAPILRGLSPYEAAERIIENLERAPIGERAKEGLAGSLLAYAGLRGSLEATAEIYRDRPTDISPYGEQG